MPLVHPNSAAAARMGTVRERMTKGWIRQKTCFQVNFVAVHVPNSFINFIPHSPYEAVMSSYEGCVKGNV